MTSEAPKLSPCPFCGNATYFLARGVDGMPYCGECGAQCGRLDWNTRDTTHALAMVAAAYEDAAGIYEGMFDRLARLIRARTPDDAQAALDALLKAEREAGRVEGLKEASEAIADYPRIAPEEHEWVHYDEQIEYSQRCILALIEKETGHVPEN